MATLLRDKMVRGVEPSCVNGSRPNPDKTNKQKKIITSGSWSKMSFLSMLWRLIYLTEVENNWKINEWMLYKVSNTLSSGWN